MPYQFKVQPAKRLRVIIDTDAACEADDPYAIVQGLLTPRFDVRGLIAEQFQSEGGPTSVAKSRQVIEHLLGLMQRTVPVWDGVATPLENLSAAPEAPAVSALIQEARATSALPLFVLCQGALTNVAAALNQAPDIADRMTVVWIGGNRYPEGGWEFNLNNDRHAANAVFQSNVALWQVPMDAYTQMQVGYAELELKVRPCGEVGAWLFQEMQDLGLRADWIAGESWGLGDSPAVGLALNPGCGRYTERLAPQVDEACHYVGTTDHRIRVYHAIDSRYILEDLFAKLQLNYR